MMTGAGYSKSFTEFI